MSNKPYYETDGFKLIKGDSLKELKRIPYIESCFGFGDYHHITFLGNQDYSEQLKLELQTKQTDSLEIKKIAPSIEDCFMELSNR